MKNIKKINIGILTFPIAKAGVIPTANLLEILDTIFLNDISLITGNEGYIYFKDDKRFNIYEINHEKGNSTLARIVKYIYTQLKISFKLIKISRNIDIWFFFIGADTLILPMLTARILSKKVILVLAGSASQSFLSSNNKKLLKPIRILEEINYSFANSIVLHSQNLILDWNLERYRKKINFAHEYFLNFEKFKIKKNLKNRTNLIGFIGRFSEEKGVLNFIQAIEKIINYRKEIKFILIGEGYLKIKIQEYLNKHSLNEYVKVLNWVSHDKLPDYLNELRLLVIPSYTESGPIIALEAMACGTPILGTKVGQILNMVEDEKTGFVMEHNSSESIAENVIRVLNYKNLDEIVTNAKLLVENKFSYENSVNTYRKILTELLEK